MSTAIKITMLFGAILFAPTLFGGDLLVSSFFSNQVLRYDQQSGAFNKVAAQGDPAPAPDDCSQCFTGMAYGPDGNLYVASQLTHEILRYDRETGNLIDTFVSSGSGGLQLPSFILFGPDGHLYVASFSDQVLRYDGQTGAFLGVFAEGNGLDDPIGMAFGPDGNFYVAGFRSHNVLRFDGSTGAFIDVFAQNVELAFPTGLAFGPEGNLYVASNNPVVPGGGANETAASVLLFDGLSGNLIRRVIPKDANLYPDIIDIAFGPDNRLYVSAHTKDQVLRFDRISGALFDVFVPPGRGGLNGPVDLLFVPDVQPVSTWTRQNGTSGDDTNTTVSAGNDAVWIGGETTGSLAGETNAGGKDGYIQKYSTDGTLLCSDQFGTIKDDNVAGVKVDPNDPNAVYVSGETKGTLGAESFGGSDIYVKKYDGNCQTVWTKQLGTAGEETAVAGIGLPPDGSGVFAAGITDSVYSGASSGGTDGFVQKLSTDGDLICSDQFGTEFNEKRERGVIANSPFVTVGLTTETAAGDSEGLVTRYELNCSQTWTTLLGTDGDDTVNGLGLGPDDDNPDFIFVSGDTTGTFAGQNQTGDTDLYVQRYDTSGNLDYTLQFGVTGGKTMRGVIANSPTLTIAGETDGALNGFENQGGLDVVLREFTLDGVGIAALQFGSAADDHITALAHSPDNTITYAVGNTLGALPGKTSAGGTDPYLIALKVSADPVDSLEALIDLVADANLSQGIKISLVNKLNEVFEALNADPSDIETAKLELDDFIVRVSAQRGKKIPAADADLFIAEAQKIKALIDNN